jgi:hypothetical protein
MHLRAFRSLPTKPDEIVPPLWSGAIASICRGNPVVKTNGTCGGCWNATCLEPLLIGQKRFCRSVRLMAAAWVEVLLWDRSLVEGVNFLMSPWSEVSGKIIYPGSAPICNFGAV